MLRKKLSIFTSATMPNGDTRKSPSSCAVMVKTTKRKKASRRYLTLRSGTSSQSGTVKLRRNSLRPSFHRYSETVPTGQSQEQNDFFTRRLQRIKPQTRTIAAGWIAGIWCVTRKYLRFIRPAIGNQPSTPAGRSI